MYGDCPLSNMPICPSILVQRHSSASETASETATCLGRIPDLFADLRRAVGVSLLVVPRPPLQQTRLGPSPCSPTQASEASRVEEDMVLRRASTATILFSQASFTRSESGERSVTSPSSAHPTPTSVFSASPRELQVGDAWPTPPAATQNSSRSPWLDAESILALAGGTPKSPQLTRLTLERAEHYQFTGLQTTPATRGTSTEDSLVLPTLPVASPMPSGDERPDEHSLLRLSLPLSQNDDASPSGSADGWTPRTAPRPESTGPGRGSSLVSCCDGDRDEGMVSARDVMTRLDPLAALLPVAVPRPMATADNASILDWVTAIVTAAGAALRAAR